MREVDCKDGKDVAKALMTLVNRFDDGHVKPFVDEVTNDHRTLQQSAMGLFLRTILRFAANHEAGFTDARNEETGRLAVSIRAGLEQEGYVYKKEDGTYHDEIRLSCI